ncbi:endonuclease [Streptomyces sp. NPDC088785]|uniref:endonuclease n=1 Tax=Streptomyces sp. NPDC088785 TaxID=3365897 RepID=UPI00381FF421
MSRQRRTAPRDVLGVLLREHGRTYAAEAGIRLRNTPQPLYRTLVLALLLGARIRASVAVATARALYDAGLRDPRRMADAPRQRRVDALGAGGYRRYDERTATRLGDGARLVLGEFGGDLRTLRERADGDPDALRALLRRMPGIGATGSAVFLREVQDVWPEYAPFLDPKALGGAERLGLPTDPDALVRLAGDASPGVLAAALVRAALDQRVVDDCLDRAHGARRPDGGAAR